jgi:hypothetical protein
MRLLFLLLLAVTLPLQETAGFLSQSHRALQVAVPQCQGLERDTRTDGSSGGSVLRATSDNGDNEDEEEVPPGQMRVSEIKAELDLRQISYTDCFDKESLVERLTEARATGKANPEIIDKFNKQKIEQTFKGEKLEIDDDAINAAVANDGTLPGGLTPEQFKKLTSDPEIMALLQSPKMQDAMKLMMYVPILFLALNRNFANVLSR